MTNTIPVEGATTNVYPVRTDEVSTIHYAVSKIALGAAGAFQAYLIAGQQTLANSISVAIASDQPTSTLKTLGDASKSVQTTEIDDILMKSKIDPIQNPAAGGTTQVIKASAGRLVAVQIFNKSTSWRYVKLYNKATDASSSDTPVKRLEIPPGGGMASPIPKGGWAFATGIAYRATTGAADGDVTSPTAGDVTVNFDYI